MPPPRTKLTSAQRQASSAAEKNEEEEEELLALDSPLSTPRIFVRLYHDVCVSHPSPNLCRK